MLNILSNEEIFYILKTNKRKKIYLIKPKNLENYRPDCHYLFELEYIDYNDIDWNCKPTHFTLLQLKVNKRHKSVGSINKRHSWGLLKKEIDWKKTLSTF